MLTDVRPWAAPAISRRTVLALAAGGALALAGCSPGTDPGPTAPATEDVDAGLAEASAAQEESLIALYDATLATYPALAPVLSDLRVEHIAHRGALVGDGGSAPLAAPAVAASEALALAALLDAERQAVAQRSQACVSAQGTDTTRLLALIAASEAGHVEFLRQAST